MESKSSVKAIAVVLVVLSCAACAHKTVKSLPAEQTAAQAVATTVPDTNASPIEAANPEPSVRNYIPQSIPELKTVHFDFDSSVLGPEARYILASNADWLKEHADARVQIAGNCDQRGTIEYNIALGQRRAAAVREYYGYLGVEGSRVATISYGKEKLLCQEANEACWQKNRRAETLLASTAK